MTHNWHSPQKDAEILDAKKLSFGMAVALASSTLISANSANAHAETTTASASTETSNAAKVSTVSTSSGLVVGKTGTSSVSTAAAGTTAGTQSSASSTAAKTAAQAMTSSSNSSSNFAEKHKDFLDRAKNRYYGAALMQLNGSEFKVGTKTKEDQDVYVWLSMDSSLATAYKPLKLQDAPTKPTISYHDVSVVTPQEPTVTTQYASVKYIDATTGKVIKVDKLNGASGSKSGIRRLCLLRSTRAWAMS